MPNLNANSNPSFRWINFQKHANPFGIEQPACNGCGNCLSGCNIGAKNTLNLNYLADARAHGAHIFTEVLKQNGILCINLSQNSGTLLSSD